MKGYHTQSLDVSSANDSANDFRPYAAGAMMAKVSLTRMKKMKLTLKVAKRKLKSV